MSLLHKALLLSTSLAVVLGLSLTPSAKAADAGYMNDAPPPSMASPADWSGFYFGGHAGYGFGKAFDSLSCPGVGDIGSVSVVSGSPADCINGNVFALTAMHNEVGAPWETTNKFDDISGGLIGLQLGYLHQMDRFVLGAEVTGSFSNLEDHATTLVDLNLNNQPGIFDAIYDGRINMDWFGTAVVRAGYVVTPDILLSLNAGMALGHLNFLSSAGYSDDNTQTGWTVGAQADYKLSHSTSLFLGYSFMQFNNVDFRGASLGGVFDNRHEYDFDFHVIKVGANYHFQ